MRRPGAAKMAFVTAGPQRRSRFTPSRQDQPCSHYMGLDWCVSSMPQRRIRVKVALFDTAALIVIARAGSRESEDRSALDLCVSHLRLTGNPQSTGADDAFTLTFSFPRTATPPLAKIASKGELK